MLPDEKKPKIINNNTRILINFAQPNTLCINVFK